MLNQEPHVLNKFPLTHGTFLAYLPEKITEEDAEYLKELFRLIMNWVERAAVKNQESNHEQAG